MDHPKNRLAKKISQGTGNFTPSDRVIADYLLRAYPLGLLQNASEIADELDINADFDSADSIAGDKNSSIENSQDNVTASSLSLDTDFDMDTEDSEFATGPDDEFGFEFEEDLGDLTEPESTDMGNSTPLSFDTTTDNFDAETTDSDTDSFTFETEEETAQDLDAFPDIEFSDDAAPGFQTSEEETDSDQFAPSLDKAHDSAFTEQAHSDLNSEAADKETSTAAEPVQSNDDIETGIKSVIPSKVKEQKEEREEDFGAAFEQMEPSLSAQSLDDIAASILKDQETPAPIEPETKPLPEIEPEPKPAPVAKPVTLFARCEGCNHKLAYKETLSGKRVRCPACSAAFKLP